jgi:hypothetical protein
MKGIMQINSQHTLRHSPLLRGVPNRQQIQWLRIVHHWEAFHPIFHPSLFRIMDRDPWRIIAPMQFQPGIAEISLEAKLRGTSQMDRTGVTRVHVVGEDRAWERRLLGEVRMKTMTWRLSLVRLAEAPQREGTRDSFLVKSRTLTSVGSLRPKMTTLINCSVSGRSMPQKLH